MNSIYDLKEKVFRKGKVIPGKAPSLYRRDKCGNIIYWHSYGRNTDMGWHIDHCLPVVKGGTNHLNNLQPLQSKENRRKAGKHPHTCNVPSHIRGFREQDNTGLLLLGVLALCMWAEMIKE